MQSSLAILKPDAIERRLVGEIIQRIERTGLAIRDIRLVCPTESIVAAHYMEHSHAPHFKNLVRYMTRGPVVLIQLEGSDCVGLLRSLRGSTDPSKAEPGTITGDLGQGRPVGENLMHASATPEDVVRETTIWLPLDHG